MSASTVNSSDRRVCDRVEHARQVVIRLGQKHWINGQTQDISLGGVSVAIEEEIEDTWLDQSMLLYIKDSHGELSPAFPCTIVRTDSDSLCLQLDRKKAAQFGAMITRRLFKRKSS